MYQQSNHGANTLPDIKDRIGLDTTAKDTMAMSRLPKNDAVKRIRNLSNSAQAKAKGKAKAKAKGQAKQGRPSRDSENLLTLGLID